VFYDTIRKDTRNEYGCNLLQLQQGKFGKIKFEVTVAAAATRERGCRCPHQCHCKNRGEQKINKRNKRDSEAPKGLKKDDKYISGKDMSKRKKKKKKKSTRTDYVQTSNQPVNNKRRRRTTQHQRQNKGRAGYVGVGVCVCVLACVLASNGGSGGGGVNAHIIKKTKTGRTTRYCTKR